MTNTRTPPALTLSLTLRVADALVFTPNRADIRRITTYQSVPYALHTATTANPSGGEVTYSLLSTFPQTSLITSISRRQTEL